MQVKVEPVGTLDDDPKEDATEHYGRSIQSGDAESDFMEYCDVSGSDIKEEVSNIKNEPGTGIQCDICLQFLPTAQTLVAHRRTHTRDLTYTCLICYKTYTDKTHLHTHIKYIHACAFSSINRNTVSIEVELPTVNDRPGIEEVQCDICLQILPTAQTLVAHRRIHTMDLTYTCLMCYGIFTDRAQLCTHMKYRHACATSSGVRNINVKSDVSQKELKIKDKLEVHIRTHTDKRLFECRVVLLKMHFDQNLDVPNARISSKEQLNKSFECHFCHLGYCWKHNLMRHIRKKHPGRKSYECAICHKLFKSKITLSTHMPTCHEERYECLICNKLFERKSFLKEHILTHTDQNPCDECILSKEKPLKCHICDIITFSKKCNLTRHMLRQHTDRIPSKIHVSPRRLPQQNLNQNHEQILVKEELEKKSRECPIVYSRRNGLIGHMRNNNADQILAYTHMPTCLEERYECLICNKLFKRKRSLKAHILTHTDQKPFEAEDRILSKEKPFKCHICDKITFTTKGNLRKHMRNKHAVLIPIKEIHNKVHRHQCNICQRLLKTKPILKKHMLTHTTEKLYECDICHKFFKKSYITAHKRIHTERNSFECKICNIIYNKKNTLARHIRNHIEQERYECLICNKVYKRKEHLKEHMRTHSGERPYECEICHKRFRNSGSFHSHKRVHTEERLHECDVCGMRFKSNSGLTIHNLTHTGEKPYECDVCHKKCTHKTALNAHKRMHSDEKRFKCKICNKRFVQPAGLATHMRIHSAEKMYKCVICYKEFNFKHNLTVHLRTHTGEKPYECNVCKSRFASSGMLSVHRRIHNIVTKSKELSKHKFTQR